MSTTLNSLRVPRCTQCLRSYASGNFIDTKVSWGGLLHTRGKKKVKVIKGPQETVRLLKNMKGIGRPGDFVAVSATEMRRVWIPHRIAVYPTASELRSYRASSGSEQSSTSALLVPELSATTRQQSAARAPPKVPKLAVDHLSPIESKQLLETLLPAELEVFRRPKLMTAEQLNPVKQPDGVVGAGMDMFKAISEGLHGKEIPVQQPIYGSVTTQDVHQAVTSILAADVTGSRVVLSPDDFHFKPSPERGLPGGSKVGHLGAFTFEIRFKALGDTKPVQRIMHVRPVNQEDVGAPDSLLKYL